MGFETRTPGFFDQRFKGSLVSQGVQPSRLFYPEIIFDAIFILAVFVCSSFVWEAVPNEWKAWLSTWPKVSVSNWPLVKHWSTYPPLTDSPCIKSDPCSQSVYVGSHNYNCDAKIELRQNLIFNHKIINAVARLIFNLRRSDHVSDARISLHWLRVPERIRSEVAVSVYKVRHGCASSYLGPFTYVADLPSRRGLHSSCSDCLVQPPVHRSTVGSRAFSVAGFQGCGTVCYWRLRRHQHWRPSALDSRRSCLLNHVLTFGWSDILCLHTVYILVLFFFVLVIPKCGRLSWPALWSTFRRTMK